MPRIDLVQIRRGTAADWAAANPVLLPGEPGVETDTGKSKIGDGAKDWATLSYVDGLVPTGTGFRHITSGVEDGAAQLVTDSDVAAGNIDGLASKASMRTLGTGAQQAAAGNHTHAAADTVSGQFVMARLASGAPDGTKFIRDDGVLATPPGGGSADVKAATITAPYNVTEHTEVVADAAVSAGQQVLVGWGASTDDDENHPTMDALTFMGVAGTGTVTFTIASPTNEPFGGPIKLNYQAA